MTEQAKSAEPQVNLDRFRSLLDHSEDAIFIADHETLKIIEVNAKACKYLYLERDLLVGKPFEHLLSPQAWKKVLKWLPTSALTTSKRLIVPSVLLGDKNRKMPTEIAFSVDRSGNTDYIVVVVRDVTMKKQAEENLKMNERVNHLLTHGLRGYLWGCDPELRFTYVSPSVESVLGYTLREVMELSVEDLYVPDSLKVVREAFAELMDTSKDTKGVSSRFRTIVIEVIRKDGSFIWTETTMLASKTTRDRNTGYVGVSRDITARVRSEEKLRALEAQVQQTQKLESLGVLAGGIAHDFNNLLTGIQGYASLALLKLDKDSPARSYLRAQGEAATRATELTSQLLAYSGKGKFVVRSIDLRETVEGLAHLLQVSISKKVTIEFNFDKSLPRVEGDVAQIQQVVMNLITNASEAIGDETGVVCLSTGTVEVDAKFGPTAYSDRELEAGEYVYLEVSDSGCGMDDETISRIFDPFFTTKFTGRGLGLAAVLGIIRSHGGDIKIDSEVGKGTTIRVLFPCTGKPEISSITQARPDSALDDVLPTDATILVVDDEDIVRSVAKAMLEEAGFSVVVAKDGYEAVHLFSEQPDGFAAVLLDLTMPRMDGEETLGKLLQIRVDIPVILSSGYSEEDVTARFQDSNPAGFVQKPYRTTDLIDEVKAVLGIQAEE